MQLETAILVRLCGLYEVKGDNCKDHFNPKKAKRNSRRLHPVIACRLWLSCSFVCLLSTNPKQDLAAASYSCLFLVCTDRRKLFIFERIDGLVFSNTRVCFFIDKLAGGLENWGETPIYIYISHLIIGKSNKKKEPDCNKKECHRTYKYFLENEQRDVKSIPSPYQWYHHHLLVRYFGHNQFYVPHVSINYIWVVESVSSSSMDKSDGFSSKPKVPEKLDFSHPWSEIQLDRIGYSYNIFSCLI